ncbi:MAG: SCO2322 family protein [Actinomycetes bacterium]
MNAPRRVGAALAALTAGTGIMVVATVGASTPARAASYQYWSYWQGRSSGWSYATIGPASDVLADGALEGWRFEISPESGAVPPRSRPRVATLCASTPPLPDRIRVGLVVDFGTSADAPAGQQPPPGLTRCVQVPVGSTGADVLVAAGTTIRTDSSGLFCALDGYPTTGCGRLVSTPGGSTPAPSASPTAADGTTTAGTAMPTSNRTGDGGTTGHSPVAVASTPTAARTGRTTSGPQHATLAARTAPESTPVPSKTPSTRPTVAGHRSSAGAAIGVGVLVLALAGAAWARGRHR